MKNTSLLVALSLVAFAGCSRKKEEGTVQRSEGSATVAPPPAPKPETPKKLEGSALADRYKECVGNINDGKLDEFQKDCLDPSFASHDINDPKPHSAADLVGFFKAMRAGMPDMKLAPQLIMVSGRNLLAIELMTGTQTAPLALPNGMTIPATSKKIGLLMFHKLVINDANLATEERAYDDMATMLGQLGQGPKDAPPVRPASDKGLEGAPIVLVTADDAKEKANLELIKKGVDAFNARKLDDWAKLSADNVVASVQTLPADITGIKEVRKPLESMLAGFPDIKKNVDSQSAAGDWVIELGRATGTNTGDVGKMKKTGKPVTLDYAEVFQIKDGKIAALWRFASGFQMAAQLGLLPAPSAAAGSAATVSPSPAGSAAAAAAGSAAAATVGSAAPAGGSAAAPVTPKP